jgi:hypothetical protein
LFRCVDTLMIGDMNHDHQFLRLMRHAAIVLLVLGFHAGTSAAEPVSTPGVATIKGLVIDAGTITAVEKFRPPAAE